MRRLFAVGVIAMVLLAGNNGAWAFAQSTHNGLVISPALVQLTLGKGQDSISFKTDVTNDSLGSVTIAVTVDDFTALNTSGTPLFLNNMDRLAAPHGLAHWMSPEITQFTLKPQESRRVPVDITGATSLAAGGHYGAVIFSIVPSASGVLKNTVTANASVSTLIFLTTDNPGVQAIKLEKPSVGRFVLALPGSVDIVFTNTGDVQTMPRGTVNVIDGSGRDVAKGIINADSGQVLPSTKRLYQVQLTQMRRFVWPGTYQLQIRYHHDGQAASTLYSERFVYVPAPIVALVGFLMLLGVGLLLRRMRSSQFVRATRL